MDSMVDSEMDSVVKSEMESCGEIRSGFCVDSEVDSVMYTDLLEI